MLVAVEEERITGFVWAGPTTDVDDDPGQVGQIRSLHVDPGQQGRGLGSRLLRSAAEQMAGSGHRHMSLWVVTDNVSARTFYERQGWQADGTHRREKLAMPGEDGPTVTVLRYRRRTPGPGEETLTMSGTARRGTAGSRPPTSGGDPAKGDSRLPKHVRLKEQLRAQIANLPPGTALKPERVLSEEFAASRTTVRNALMELAVEGRIVRLQGRGTFVAPPKVTLPLRLASYTQDMQERGTRPGSRLLDWRGEPADGDVAAHLGIDPGTPILRFERLRLADGTPMAVEVVHLEAGRFAALEELMGDDVSLYSLLSQHWGLSPVSAEETIETVMASPPTSGLLETEAGTPMLLLTRTTHADDGRPFEFVRSLYRGDRYRFVTRLERPAGSTA